VLWSQTGLVPAAGQAPLANPYVAARENSAAGGWAETQVVESTTQSGDATTDQVVGLQALGPATGISAAWLRVPAGSAGDRVRSARRETPTAWSYSNIAAGVTGVTRSELAFAANDAGVQAVVWIEPVNNVPQVMLRVRRIGAGGFDWTPPGAVQVATSQPASNPALAVDSAGRVIVVWRQIVNASVGELRSRTYDVSSGTFSLELPVQPNQPDMRNPRVIAIGPNQFIAVWEQASSNIYDLRGRAGNASNWIGMSSIVIDTRVEEVSGARLLAGPNDTALVLWQQADSLYASRWAGATGVWGLPAQVGAGLSGVARDLRAAGDATGRAIVAWSQAGTSGVKDLYYALVSGGTPDVTQATLLEVAAGTASAPAVAMNASGAAVVTWLQAISGQTQPDVVARVAR
jgi:hypothetical protein